MREGGRWGGKWDWREGLRGIEEGCGLKDWVFQKEKWFSREFLEMEGGYRVRIDKGIR